MSTTPQTNINDNQTRKEKTILSLLMIYHYKPQLSLKLTNVFATTALPPATDYYVWVGFPRTGILPVSFHFKNRLCWTAVAKVDLLCLFVFLRTTLTFQVKFPDN